MQFLIPIAGYTLQGNMHNKTSREQLGVTNTAEDIALGSSEGNEETTQKGWRVIDCLKSNILQPSGKKKCWET